MTLKELIKEHGFNKWYSLTHNPHKKQFYACGFSSCDKYILGHDENINTRLYAGDNDLLCLWIPRPAKKKITIECWHNWYVGLNDKLFVCVDSRRLDFYCGYKIVHSKLIYSFNLSIALVKICCLIL